MSRPITQRIHPPWTPEEVVLLNTCQGLTGVSPIVCPNHRPPQMLRAGIDGWTCPQCDYSRTWAFSWMVDPMVVRQLVRNATLDTPR